MTDPTPRGYPIFTGTLPPAGPAQMQQLAEAIDADATETEAALTASTAALTARVTALEVGVVRAVTMVTGWTGSTLKATKDGASVTVSGDIAFAGTIPAGTHAVGSLPEGIPTPAAIRSVPITGFIAGHSALYETRGTVQITPAGAITLVANQTLTSASLAMTYIP